MELTVYRYVSNSNATLSKSFVDGKHQCVSLEDGYRETKVANETRIPCGRYKIGLRTVGGYHARYSARFPDFHRGMLQVLDVPGFEYILIHIGNTDEDTAGCLLVGTDAIEASRFMVASSKVAYIALYKKVIEAAANDDLYITYIDGDIAA